MKSWVDYKLAFLTEAGPANNVNIVVSVSTLGVILIHVWRSAKWYQKVNDRLIGLRRSHIRLRKQQERIIKDQAKKHESNVHDINQLKLSIQEIKGDIDRQEDKISSLIEGQDDLNNMLTSSIGLPSKKP